MFLLQTGIAVAKEAAESTGLKGWSLVAVYALVILGLIIYGIITQKIVIPRMIKKEETEAVASITKEKFNELVKESEILTGESNTVFQRLNTIDAALTDINKYLVDAKNEREWFNRDTISRLNVMTSEMRKINLVALEASVYADGPVLTRMCNFIAYMKLGGNGNCLDFACTNLILHNKELWKSLFQQINDLSNVVNKELYLANLDEIKKRVLW